MNANDTYKTIVSNKEAILFKEKNSKFFGYALYVTNEADIENYLKHIKKEHYAARHWCYAYQIGTEQKTFRTSDDGEPKNSAGMPIYGQLLSFNITNVMVVVVRYFGGTKLGIGGLIKAYRTTAKRAIESTKIIEKTIQQKFLITFDYKDMSKVMRIIKEQNLTIIEQNLNVSCSITISVRKQLTGRVLNVFETSYGIGIELL